MDITRNIITMGASLKPGTFYNTVWSVEGKVVHTAPALTPVEGDPRDFFDRWAEVTQLLFEIPHVDIQVFEVADDTRN